MAGIGHGVSRIEGFHDPIVYVEVQSGCDRSTIDPCHLLNRVIDESARLCESKSITLRHVDDRAGTSQTLSEVLTVWGQQILLVTIRGERQWLAKEVGHFVRKFGQ